MNELFAIALSFPTVVFTVLMVPVLCLWALTLSGLVDVEILDATDGAIDGALEGAVDGAMEGALEGAADGAAEGLLDGGVPITMQALQALGVGKLPISILVGFSVLFAWVISATLAQMLGSALPISVGIGIVAIVGGMISGSLVARPLAPLYAKNPAKRRRHFVGNTCEVTTGTVDGSFGQADVADGGAGLLVQVRCDTPNTLGRGDQALILSFDDSREAFMVTPLNQE